MENLKKKIDLKMLYILFCSIFAIPSVIYLISNKTILNFDNYFSWSLTNSNQILDSVIFALLFIIINILYILIVKNRRKLFSSIKSIIIFIFIISCIFMIVVPLTSSDIFYYIGVGWLQNNYHENPYYTSITDLNSNNDGMFNNIYSGWKDITVVYGPLFTILSMILSLFSFGNVTVAMFIFKIINLIVHILNCYIIYKISKKKIFVLLYGLNPFVLFEMLSNVHNDILLVLFILLSIYFLVKKKKILLSIIFLAIASSIKYIGIILLPFILIYYLKEKTLLKKIPYCIFYGIIFILLNIIFYLPYMKDISIFTSVLAQQGKYSQSVILCIMILNDKINGIDLLYISSRIIYILFIISAGILIGEYINTNKNTKLSSGIKKYNFLLLIVIFLVLSNFKQWYIIWLFPSLIWQRKRMINIIINLSIASELALFPFFLYNSDGWKIAPYYTMLLVVLMLLFEFLSRKKHKIFQKKLGEKKIGKTSSN